MFKNANITQRKGQWARRARLLSFRLEFPGLHGFSVRNLKYMKVFAREWRGNAIGQRLVAQLPWGHNIVLLESVSSVGERLTYARLALKNGWSRSVLEHQIEMGAADLPAGFKAKDVKVKVTVEK